MFYRCMWRLAFMAIKLYLNEIDHVGKIKLKTVETTFMSAISKVLIVDDELDICYLLSGMLKQRNFRTGFVNSLSDAVIALQTDKPSLLVLDNHLPDGLGLDFIPYVKKNFPEIKVIMITAHDGSLE